MREGKSHNLNSFVRYCIVCVGFLGVSVFLFLVILTFCVMRRRARKSRERSSIYKKLLDDAEQNLDVQIKQVSENKWVKVTLFLGQVCLSCTLNIIMIIK